MARYFKTGKPCPTDLTWEERHPFSYRLDVEAMNKIEQAIEKYKKEKSRKKEKEKESSKKQQKK